MFCPNCGKEQVDNAKFCPSCGTKLVQESVIQSDIEPEIRPSVEPRVNQGIQLAQTKLTCRERPGLITWVLGVPLVLVVFILSMLVIKWGTENLVMPARLFGLLTVLVVIVMSVGAALLLVFFTTRKVRVTPLMEVRVDINESSWQVALIAFNFGLLGILLYALTREIVGHRFVLCEEGVLVQHYFERWRSLRSYSAYTTQSQIRLQRGRRRTILLDLPKEQFDAAEQIIASHLQQTR